MAEPGRMQNYDIRNDGIGPYAVFYCEYCDREYRSQPDVRATVAKDVGRQTMGGLLRNIPIVGGTLADRTEEDDPRYTVSLTSDQLDRAWGQVKDRFRECPTCRRIVCLSDFDEKSGFCTEDSPRRDEIAEAQAEQAGAVLKGFASALGLGDLARRASEATRQATERAARCPSDGYLAPAGTKFCPECGSAMVQPTIELCPNCGKETAGAKFCPECGVKVQRASPGVCSKCGAKTGSAKFCPECGTKLV